MTQEERKTVLIDLCARLSYHTMVLMGDGAIEPLISINVDTYICNGLKGLPKPYLRPMSSMTDDERDKFRNVGGVMSHNLQNDTWAICTFTPEAYDWLNEHHFDYRGLIEKGLALESPEGMYKTE